MTDKLPLNKVLAAIDKKDYGFYSRLSDEEKKQIQAFVLNRFCCSVKGTTDLQAYYLIATNERVNKYFFDFHKHPDLQWKRLCTVSPGMGKQYHEWIPHKKEKTTNSKFVKFLMKQYPERKREDVELWASKFSKKEIKEFLDNHGLTEKDI